MHEQLIIMTSTLQEGPCTLARGITSNRRMYSPRFPTFACYGYAKAHRVHRTVLDETMKRRGAAFARAEDTRSRSRRP